MTSEQAHRLARERGVSRLLYALARLVLVPFLRVYCRVRVSGAEQIPKRGPAIIAANHKDFWDAFFIALATKRHVRFMAASETLQRRAGRLLVRLGAFPVRRGESDQDAIETAKVILRQGGLVAVFPEGDTIADADALGAPHRGAARLALELGAPLIPAAITGTGRLRRGSILLPRQVQVAFAEPILAPARIAPTVEAATDLTEDRVWPAVQAEFYRLRSRPGVIAAALTALGIGGAVALRRPSVARRRGLARFRRIRRRGRRSG